MVACFDGRDCGPLSSDYDVLSFAYFDFLGPRGDGGRRSMPKLRQGQKSVSVSVSE
jgi:hypothetical protein